MDGGVLKSERAREFGGSTVSAFKAGGIYLQETGSKRDGVEDFWDLKNRLVESERDKWKISGNWIEKGKRGGGEEISVLKNLLEESERDKWEISGLQVSGGDG
ncbi:hypothetical protein CEXT_68561 [Caerostris extrusa]|uniref:Uncharacterized protein n=1 Tax=Caerostris extrusa TaxID=172846 RepID=A0AAV4TR05_CAEEX|nr:hypothetical protein CEXT_68561 [Caerostris extrusa]